MKNNCCSWPILSIYLMNLTVHKHNYLQMANHLFCLTKKKVIKVRIETNMIFIKFLQFFISTNIFLHVKAINFRMINLENQSSIEIHKFQCLS
jgi:hypothetical protein